MRLLPIHTPFATGLLPPVGGFAPRSRPLPPGGRGSPIFMAVPPNVPLVSGALRGDASPFLRFGPLLGFGPCGAQPDYGSRGWGFESSWAHNDLAASLSDSATPVGGKVGVRHDVFPPGTTRMPCCGKSARIFPASSRR